MKRYLSLVLLILLVASAVTHAGVPTVSSVAITKELALNHYEQSNWKSAVEHLELWEAEAQMIASLTLAATKPGTNSVALRELTTNQLSVMADYSGVSGTFSRERNEAIFLQAKCYYNLGEHEEALACLERLFELVTYRQWDLWTDGRKLLSEILELKIE